MDTDILSWIFTASFIRRCFYISKSAPEVRMKEQICELVNQICGVDGTDVSSVKGECECLVGAVVV